MICADCKHHREFTGLCLNPDSNFRADFTDSNFGCDKYEPRECVGCEHYVNHQCREQTEKEGS